jgi:hypothetical protein
MDRPLNYSRDGVCTVPGCEKVRYVRGLCAMHYGRAKAGADMDAPSMQAALEERFWRKVPRRPEDPDACWDWAGARNKHGYGRILGEAGLGRKYRLAHQVAWGLAHGPIPEGLLVRHRVCGNPACVRVEHLALGTAQDNADDMVRHGRSCRGEEQALARLTEDLVREIRGSSESTNALARRLKVGTSTVRDIRKGRTWAWVE